MAIEMQSRYLGNELEFQLLMQHPIQPKTLGCPRQRPFWSSANWPLPFGRQELTHHIVAPRRFFAKVVDLRSVILPADISPEPQGPSVFGSPRICFRMRRIQLLANRVRLHPSRMI